MAGEINAFQAGIGMIGARLGVPVVPVRLEGLDRVLHQKAKMATPGRVRIAFGAPMHLRGRGLPGRWRSRSRRRCGSCEPRDAVLGV